MSRELIVFTSLTCAPCKQLKPELERLQQQRGFSMRIVQMTPATSSLFDKYGVRAVPTVVCRDGGSEIGRFVGAMTPTAVECKLAEWGLW